MVKQPFIKYDLSYKKNARKKMLDDALKNIAPTSIATASEQTFSIATDFIPKKRSKLSDKAIDDLIFEKGYFQNENWKYL